LTFLPQQNQNVTSILLHSQHSQLSTANKTNGFVKKSSLQRFLIDCREVLTKPITKIVVPNQFPGLLLYVDKCGRILAT
jgi:hypothetical protein